MAILLQINKLNYQINDDKIFNISLDVQKGDYISIIAPNKSGKTILTKLICAIIPTDNMFQIDGIILNKERSRTSARKTPCWNLSRSFSPA